MCRDSDQAIIRPLPRAKRVLSEPNVLPHIVQLLLTFDPRLVERVVNLLNVVMEVKKVYLDGQSEFSLPPSLPPSLSLSLSFSLPLYVHILNYIIITLFLVSRTTLSFPGSSPLVCSSSS